MAFFHVSIGGLEPLSYRWQHCTGANAAWEDIAGATGPTLNKSHDGYQYRVTVTDVLSNSVTSDIATISLNAPPPTGDPSQPFMYALWTVLFAAAVILLLRRRRVA